MDIKEDEEEGGGGKVDASVQMIYWWAIWALSSVVDLSYFERV